MLQHMVKSKKPMYRSPSSKNILFSGFLLMMSIFPSFPYGCHMPPIRWKAADKSLKPKVIEQMWRDSEERQMVLSTMTAAEIKRRRYA